MSGPAHAVQARQRAALPARHCWRAAATVATTGQVHTWPLASGFDLASPRRAALDRCTPGILSNGLGWLGSLDFLCMCVSVCITVCVRGEPKERRQAITSHSL